MPKSATRDPFVRYYLSQSPLRTPVANSSVPDETKRVTPCRGLWTPVYRPGLTGRKLPVASVSRQGSTRKSVRRFCCRKSYSSSAFRHFTGTRLQTFSDYFPHILGLQLAIGVGLFRSITSRTLIHLRLELISFSSLHNAAGGDFRNIADADAPGHAPSSIRLSHWPESGMSDSTPGRSASIRQPPLAKPHARKTP